MSILSEVKEIVRSSKPLNTMSRDEFIRFLIKRVEICPLLLASQWHGKAALSQLGDMIADVGLSDKLRMACDSDTDWLNDLTKRITVEVCQNETFIELLQDQIYELMFSQLAEAEEDAEAESLEA